LIWIRCPDGVLRDYAVFEDIVKPLWKEKMRKQDFKDKVERLGKCE
jgi:actin-like ATPase involved in cell morphogenesis